MSKIKKRADGRYQISLTLGQKDGKPLRRVVYGRTRKECREKADELRAKYSKGLDISLDRQTWEYWVRMWKASVQPIITERQLGDYTYYLKPFEELNSVQMNKLEIVDFQRIINDRAALNPTTCKPSSKRTLTAMKHAASRVFEFAIQNRAVDYNPVKYVQIPQNAPKKSRRALTEEECGWIEKLEHRAQLPAMIMLYSGLRLAECLALQWKDIDFTAHTIDVHKTLVLDGKPPYVKPGAKNEGSIRVVDIPQKLIDFLKPRKGTPFDYVVVNTQGKLFSKSAWRSLWRSYLCDLNIAFGNFAVRPKKHQPEKIPMLIEPFTAHYLRHTHTTDLIAAGCDIKYVQAQMGHADIKTTLGIYAHLSDKANAANVAKVENFFSKKAEEKSVCSQSVVKQISETA